MTAEHESSHPSISLRPSTAHIHSGTVRKGFQSKPVHAYDRTMRTKNLALLSNGKLLSPRSEVKILTSTSGKLPCRPGRTKVTQDPTTLAEKLEKSNFSEWHQVALKTSQYPSTVHLQSKQVSFSRLPEDVNFSRATVYQESATGARISKTNFECISDYIAQASPQQRVGGASVKREPSESSLLNPVSSLDEINLLKRVVLLPNYNSLEEKE